MVPVPDVTRHGALHESLASPPTGTARALAPDHHGLYGAGHAARTACRGCASSSRGPVNRDDDSVASPVVAVGQRCEESGRETSLTCPATICHRPLERAHTRV